MKKYVYNYPRPALTTDIVLFAVAEDEADSQRELSREKLQILLIRRGAEPFKDSWALPGGFVCEGESAHAAAVRELFEETGVKDVHLKQLRTFSDPGRDPRGWVVSCAYLALIPKNSVRLTAGDDAADARWFTIEQEELVSATSPALAAPATAPAAPHDPHVPAKEDCLPERLAFDHAKIIAYALKSLRENPVIEERSDVGKQSTQTV
ncbi:MAG: NUDIX hydrolase [Coriobacteriales bacterium]|jgi:ADP-ribose pyrophosphatase YjhB (NUDIX family)|nr:NUDIX hydrolase [Coriobacteriales bacterium]